MKRSDFMPYTGSSKLPYPLTIKGKIGDDITEMPSEGMEKGDAFIIVPSESISGYRPSFVVFWDGTQFRLPLRSCASFGMDSMGNTMYIVSNEFIAMFTEK